MKLIVDFNMIESLEDFHKFISNKLNFGDEYAYSLDALHHEIKLRNDLDIEVIKGGSVQMEMQELIEDMLTE